MGVQSDLEKDLEVSDASFRAIESFSDKLLSSLAPARATRLIDSLSTAFEIVTWLILPVVICLSQRLSHACLSINKFIL